MGRRQPCWGPLSMRCSASDVGPVSATPSPTPACSFRASCGPVRAKSLLTVFRSTPTRRRSHREQPRGRFDRPRRAVPRWQGAARRPQGGAAQRHRALSILNPVLLPPRVRHGRRPFPEMRCASRLRNSRADQSFVVPKFRMPFMVRSNTRAMRGAVLFGCHLTEPRSLAGPRRPTLPGISSPPRRSPAPPF